MNCHAVGLVAPYHSCSLPITNINSKYSLSAVNILANLQGGSNKNCYTVVLVAPYHSCSTPISLTSTRGILSVLSIFLLI